MKQKNSLGGDALRLTLSKIITLCISMACTMLLSRFRTVEEYGTYSQLLLVVNLFSSLFMLGLPNSINYFLARAESNQERQKFLSVYYTLSTLLSVIIGAVLSFSIPLIEAYFKNQTLRSFLYFFAIYPWANVISSSVENILIVYQKTRFMMVYRIVNSVCLLGTVLVTQWMGWGFSAYMRLYLFVFCLFAISVYVIAAKLGGSIQFSLDKTWIRAIFTFSLPIGLASVVGTLNVEIDKLLIGRLMDTETMAIYTNAARELPVTIVASSITAVLLPKVTRMLKNNDAHGAVSLWGNATELSLALIALIVAGVFTYAEDVMTLLYSAKYLSGLSVFRVYTLVLLLRCTYFGMILNAKGKSKSILYSSIASLGLNVILNPLFFLWLGMVGPAIATIVSMTIVLTAQLIFSAKYIEISFWQIFPWKRLGQVLLINAVFAFCFSWLKYVLPLDLVLTSLGESLVLGAVWSILYVFAMRHRLVSAWQGLNN